MSDAVETLTFARVPLRDAGTDRRIIGLLLMDHTPECNVDHDR
jgi:hypothetical protein